MFACNINYSLTLPTRTTHLTASTIVQHIPQCPTIKDSVKRQLLLQPLASTDIGGENGDYEATDNVAGQLSDQLPFLRLHHQQCLILNRSA